MMKSLLFPLFLLTSILVQSQVYEFKPIWKVGEQKTINITHHTQEFENDTLITDSTSANEIKIEVIKENKEAFIIKLSLENQALQSAVSFYHKIGEELTEYHDLQLIASINKETAEAELINWEEAQTFMFKSFDAISDKLDEKVPEKAAFASFLFMPLKEVFKDKKNISDYMLENIHFMLSPFNQEFNLNQTITKVETEKNPFNPMQEINATTKLTLMEVNEDTNSALIKQEVFLDLSEFLEMIKGMMQKMAQTFGANDSIVGEKSNEIDEIEMDITNEMEIIFNMQSTWVSKAIRNAIVTSTDPKDGLKSRTVVKTTYVIQ